MKNIKIWGVLAALIAAASSAVQADTIVIHNKTNRPIFASVYCSSLLKGTKRSNGPIKIDVNQSNSIDRTKSSFTCRRYLVVSSDQSALTASISGLESDHWASFGIGRVSGGKEENELYVITNPETRQLSILNPENYKRIGSPQAGPQQGQTQEDLFQQFESQQQGNYQQQQQQQEQEQPQQPYNPPLARYSLTQEDIEKLKPTFDYMNATFIFNIMDPTSVHKYPDLARKQARLILKINENETNPTVIKKAYINLQRKFHPDRNKDALAASAFKLINQANALLKQ